LREELGLTLEALAYESDLGSMGHLSDIEAGRVRSNVRTLAVLAERLGVLLADLVIDADRGGVRERLLDASRLLPQDTLRRWLREAETARRASRRPPGGR
jgi:transcriptional regulator with XRE-family HTH domain